jgi:hypothetical protein
MKCHSSRHYRQKEKPEATHALHHPHDRPPTYVCAECYQIWADGVGYGWGTVIQVEHLKAEG